MTELKPCPFCGGPAGTFVFIRETGFERNCIQFTVRCQNCGVEKSRLVSYEKTCDFTDIERGMDKATDLWNWRATDEATNG